MNQFDLNELKSVIAEKYNWGDPSNWTNFHFKELSAAIEKATGNRISEETLKRIFGKRKVESDAYQPQAFTRLTLINFAKNLEKKHSTKKKKYIISNYRNAIIITLAAIITAILLFFISQKRTSNYYFTCSNPIDSYPFTATFNYDVGNIRDSVFCAFTDNSETYLPPDKNMINFFYGAPDIYNIRLYTRKQKLDSLKVVAWSKNWTAGYFLNFKPHLRRLFKDQKFYRHENYFYAKPEDLKEKIINWDANYWTEYFYIYPFDIVLDNLKIETQIQNNDSTGSLPCYDTQISLTGMSGEVKLKFTQLKCSRFVSLQISEKKLDGKFDDLSDFSVDMSDWLNISIQIIDKHINVYLKEKLIFEEDYANPLGKFVGITYSFYGTGIIKNLKILSNEESVIYRNNFRTK